MRIRRGPATVTGEAFRTREQATGPITDREGASGRPGSQETSLRPQARSPRGRGGSLQFHRSPAWWPVSSASPWRAPALSAPTSPSVPRRDRRPCSKRQGDGRSPTPSKARPTDGLHRNERRRRARGAPGANWDRAARLAPRERILGESHDFSRPDYWAVWLDARRATSAAALQGRPPEGNEVLLFVDRCEYPQAARLHRGTSRRRSGSRAGRREGRDTGRRRPQSATQYGYPGSTDAAGGRDRDRPAAPAPRPTRAAAPRVRFGQTGDAPLKASQAGTRARRPSGSPSPRRRPRRSAPRRSRRRHRRARRAHPGIRNGQRFKRKRAPRTLRGSSRRTRRACARSS